MKLESPLWTNVAGIDEAGRGPLAGPVVAAAVVLPEGFDSRGILDSKVLSPVQRFEAEERIKSQTCWSVEFVEAAEIDRINILQATFLAMRKSFQGLSLQPEMALIDGNQVPPGLGVHATAIVKGDSKETCISAASILAKCARDRYMIQMNEEYPEYGFASHFGYGTPEHLTAIQKFGACPLHRMSFAPLKPELQLCLMLED